MRCLRLSTIVQPFRRRHWCRRERKNRKQKEQQSREISMEDLPLDLSLNIKQQEQQSREISMEDLPLDLSLNILKRLPITSLLSFKLASKACYAMATNPLLAWNCLIIDPLIGVPWNNCRPLYYYKERVNRYPIHVIGNGEVVRTIEEPKIKGRKIDQCGLVLATNGLLCLFFLDAMDLRVCLCNPLMGEPNFLPKFRDSHRESRYWTENTFGFGYNASTRAYKVIRIAGLKECLTDGRYGYRLQAKVITVGKKGCGQWSKIGKPFLWPLHSSDVVVGDALHWICREGEEDGDRRTNDIHWFRKEEYCTILSFDLSKEKFHKVSPPDCRISPDHCCLSVLGGCLALTCNSIESDIIQIHIWTMKEYGVKESWTKEFVIRSTKFQESLVLNYGLLCPWYRLKDDKILMLYGRGALFSYDPKEELFEAMGKYFYYYHYGATFLPIGPLDRHSMKVVIYRESDVWIL